MAGLYCSIMWQARILNIFRKSMNICQIKLIMSTSLSQHSLLQVGFIQWCALYWLEPEEWTWAPDSLHFPPFAAPSPHPHNFTHAHIHYSNDGLLASSQHDRMSQVAEQRFSDSVSTRINYYWNSLLRLKYWSFSANLGLREGRRGGVFLKDTKFHFKKSHLFSLFFFLFYSPYCFIAWKRVSWLYFYDSIIILQKCTWLLWVTKLF